MSRSLRTRLILSHALPLLLIIPIMGVSLANLIERRVLLPSLSKGLTSTAVLLANFAGDQPQLFTNPAIAETYLTNLRQNINARVMFLSPYGQILGSSEPSEALQVGEYLDYEGVAKARAGQVASYVFYNLASSSEVVDVFVPVLNVNRQLIGVLRMSYTYNALYSEFIQTRYLIIAIMALGLLVGVILGWSLAISISTPIRRVTNAINELAHGNQRAPVPASGPEEAQLLAHSFNYLSERLSNLEKARRQLLANLVHELGRPLGALRSAIQALATGAAKDPQLLHDLTTGMDEETARLQRLLEELATLQDQVLGTLELDYQQLELSDWLPKVLRPWQEAALSKHLEWTTNIPADLPIISADPTRLSSAVQNLVSNAIKYTRAGGKVNVSSFTQDGEILIQVQDTGMGVNPAEQQKIFEPFYRGDQGRRFQQGMGLGLSIAHDLVEAHGGKITLNSSVGKGSTFTIHLPITRSEGFV